MAGTHKAGGPNIALLVSPIGELGHMFWQMHVPLLQWHLAPCGTDKGIGCKKEKGCVGGKKSWDSEKQASRGLEKSPATKRNFWLKAPWLFLLL